MQNQTDDQVALPLVEDLAKRYVALAVVARNLHRLGALLLTAKAERRQRQCAARIRSSGPEGSSEGLMCSFSGAFAHWIRSMTLLHPDRPELNETRCAGVRWAADF